MSDKHRIFMHGIPCLVSSMNMNRKRFHMGFHIFREFQLNGRFFGYYTGISQGNITRMHRIYFKYFEQMHCSALL